jgi:putative redox protein
MNHAVTFTHGQGMSFTGSLNDHEITIDATPEFGGKDLGPSPKGLLLVSLVGCTGLDVVSLLEKMRVTYADLKISAVGHLTDEHPKVYHTIDLTYHIFGDDIDQSKVEKAVNLSKEKYCGGSAMLAKAAKINYQINYN